MAKITHELVILAQGLLGPFPAPSPACEWPVLPQLQRLLSRAEQVSHNNPSADCYSQLFKLAGIDALPDSDLPLAALSLLGEGLDPGRDCWLRVDPVCLQADRTEAVLLAHEALNLTDNEAQQLQQAMQPLLDDSQALLSTTPQHWYLRMTKRPLISTTPVAMALGCPVRKRMPQGEERLAWHRLMNEVQMVWHEHPVNQAREQNGQIPVNSIWAWGTGTLPEARSTEVTAIYGNDPVVAGVAKLLHAHYYDSHAITDVIGDLQRRAQGCYWYSDTKWQTLSQCAEKASYLDRLLQFEKEVIAPCCANLLGSGHWQIRLLTGGNVDFLITRSQWRRWWRRTTPLYKLLAGT